MKTVTRLLFIYLLFGISLIICSCGPQNSIAERPKIKANKQATFEIAGLTCNACQVTLSAALERSPGVAKADVSNNLKQVKIDFDDQQTSLLQLKNTIDEFFESTSPGIVTSLE